jgi:hypothetical protein
VDHFGKSLDLIPNRCQVTETVIVRTCVTVPDFAVTLTVYIPGASLSLGLTVRFDVPEPPNDTWTVPGDRLVLSHQTLRIFDSS